MEEKLYTEKDVQFMELAVKLSETSVLTELRGCPFGSVITKNGEIVGMAFNEVEMLKDPTAHGEVQAIRDASRNLGTFDLSGCILYTSGEPCPMCLFAAKWAGIDKIYYAASRKDAAKIGFQDADMYKLLKRGIYAIQIPECRKEAVKIMKKWQKKYSEWGYR